MSKGELVKLSAARRAVAEAKSVDELKDIRNRAEAIRYAAIQAGMGLDIINDAAEIKLRAERKAGGLLSEMDKRHGARDGKTGSQDTTPLLKDLGVTKSESSHWQAIAAVPQKMFDEQIESIKVASNRLTTAGMVKLAKDIERDEKRAQMAMRTSPQSSDLYQLIHSDIAKLDGQIKPKIVDIIVTDPPYPEEYLPVYEDLAKLGARVLKPNGIMLAMVGHIHLPRLLALMIPHLRYYWILSYNIPDNHAQVKSRKVSVGWKPILMFVNGDYDGGWFEDTATSLARDKDFHEWGQSVSGLEDLLSKFATSGDLVLDPFVGGGSTGEAALNLGCRFIGADSDDKSIRITATRLAKVQSEVSKA